MSAAPGKSLKVTLSTTQTPVTVTNDGAPVPSTTTSIGGGQVEVSIDGPNVQCPGPLVFKDSAGHVLDTVDVAPCP